MCAGRTLSGGSGQVCRPHFHTPLHPWLESKALGSGAWGGSFQQEAAPSDKPLSPAQHHHPHPLFSFPPTPPKDSTPDSVAAAALGQQDYQAAVAHATAMSVAFMQQQQELPLCGDVKPMMGAPPSKQREGAQPESCPQESSQPSGEYNAQYNAAGGDYYNYQGKGYSGAQQQNKPRPNKTRTSAGESAGSLALHRSLGALGTHTAVPRLPDHTRINRPNNTCLDTKGCEDATALFISLSNSFHLLNS